MYSLALLKEAAGGVATNSKTGLVYYDVKEYAKCIFYILKKGGAKSAAYNGTGGMHTGSANKEYNGGNNIASVKAEATLTQVNDMMMYNPDADIKSSPALLAKYTKRSVNIKQTSSFKTYKIPKIPNTHDYRRSDNKRLEYLYANPYVVWVTQTSKLMEDYINNYYDGEFLPTSAEDTLVYNKFVNFLKVSKNETANKAFGLVNSQFITGEDRSTLAFAIDLFKDSMPNIFNAYTSNTLSIDTGELELDDFNKIMAPGEVISNEYENILNLIPASMRDAVIPSANNVTTFSLKEPILSLLFLGSFVTENTNDTRMINASVKNNKRTYIFIIMNPNDKEHISEQAKIAYISAPESEGLSFNAMDVYETYMTPALIDIMEKHNLSDGDHNIRPKTIGTRDDYVYAYEIPVSVAKKLIRSYHFAQEDKPISLKKNKKASNKKVKVETQMFNKDAFIPND